MAKNKNFEIEYKLERLRRTKSRKSIRISKKGVAHKCEQCRKNIATYTGYHPFYKEMNDDCGIYRLCTDCYESAAGDI